MSTSADTTVEINETDSSNNNELANNMPIIRKIFIANVNSYQGKAIAKRLPDIKNYTTSPSGKLYEIYGSLEQSNEIDNEVVENYAPRILDRKKQNYYAGILACDVIIYDIGMHTSQVIEAQKVLDTLETKLKICEPDTDELIKYFILISTPMVWAKTPASNTENSVETFVESDYRKRRPHPCYLKHQYLEREVVNAQARHKDRLRTIVICPGVTYGGRNEIFHYIFKKAFYNKESIDIFRPERNESQFIPMIYINDFADIMYRVIEEFPPRKLRYAFAVQPKPITMKSFAVLVAKSLAGNPMKVKMSSKEEILNSSDNIITQRIYHYLTLNLKMVPTFFQDFAFKFLDDLDEMGMAIADEFRRERNLLPIKIIIDGPPCVGKTTLSKALAEQYQVHYIDPRTVIFNVIKSLEQKIEEAKMYLSVRASRQFMDEGGEEGDEQSIKGGEFDDLINGDAALNQNIADWEAELADLTEYMTSVTNNDELEFEYIKKCFVEILDSKPCSENQGYIIDGFPFDYKQAAEIFPITLFRSGDTYGGENEEQDSEEETQPVISLQPYKHSMKPTYFVVLVAQDEILCKRAMCLTEKEAVETQNTEPLMLARLAKYHERTEEDVSCANYFIDIDLIPIIIKISSDTTADQVLEMVKKQIGPPHIYPMTRSQMEELAKAELKQRKLKDDEERKLKEQILRDEEFAREKKLQEWTQKFEQLKQQEQEILEAKSLPLRSYLCKYVLPTLTEGLLKVAETKPADPIDFLAEYLFRCNPTGHVLDPAYSEDAKRLLLSLDCGIDTSAVAKLNDEESKNESLACTDSFITKQFETKGSFMTMKKKLTKQSSSAKSSSDSKISHNTTKSKK